MNPNAKLSLIERINNVPKHFHEAAKVMEILGIKEFYFYGGAIRDMYSNKKINDVDISVALPRDDRFWKAVSEEISRIPRVLGGAFNHRITSGLKERFAEKGMECTSYSGACLALKTSSGLVIDLRIKSFIDQTESEGKGFEAPINALVMTKEWNVYGLVNSIKDIENNVFKPQEGLNSIKKTMKGLIRFSHQKQNNPNLIYVPAEDASLFAHAWMQAQKWTGIPYVLGNAVYNLRRKIIDVTPS